MDFYPNHATMADVRYNVTQVLRDSLGLESVRPEYHKDRAQPFGTVEMGGSTSFRSGGLTVSGRTSAGGAVIRDFVGKAIKGKATPIQVEYSIIMFPLPTLHDSINMLAHGRLPTVFEQ